MQKMERIPVPVDLSATWYNQRTTTQLKPVGFENHSVKMHVLQPYHLTMSAPDSQRPIHTHNNRTAMLRDSDNKPMFVRRMKNPSNRLHPNAVVFDEHTLYKALMEHEDRHTEIEEPRKVHRSNVRARAQSPSGTTYLPLEQKHSHVNGDRQFDDDAEMVKSRLHVQQTAMVQHEDMPSAPVAALLSTPTVAQWTAPIESIPSKKLAKNPLESSKLHYRSSQSHGKMASHSNHVNMPVMLKFTINDAIIRSPSADGQDPLPMQVHHKQSQYRQHIHNFNTPNEVDSPGGQQDNRQYSNRPSIAYEQDLTSQISDKLQTLHQMQQSENAEIGSQRMATLASVISSQAHRPSDIEPIVMSTQMTVATGNAMDTGLPAINQVPSMNSKRADKRLRRRLPFNKRHPNADENDTITTPAKPMDLHLEFSDSYTKRRTQGINSGEEAMTTPIPATLRNTRSQLNESDREPMNRGQTKQQKQRQTKQQPHRASNGPTDVNEPTHDDDAMYFQ